MRLIDAKDIEKDPSLTYYVYNGLDSCVTVELFDELIDKTWNLYDFERALIGPALTMMSRGIKIDLHERERRIIELSKRAIKLEKRMLDMVELVIGTREFNHRSPPQMLNLLYKELMLPEQHDSKDGELRVTTNRDALERLHANYVRTRPLITLILGLRDTEKTITVLQQGLSEEGRWHFSINPAGTITGRFSSSKHPFGLGANIQNIAKDLRSIFQADPGYTLVQIDLKTAESKAVAYLAEDPAYIDANNSEDVHTLVAKMVWPEKVLDRSTADQPYYRDFTYRDMSKKGQHASNYLESPYGMARNLKITKTVAEEFQRKYFRSFPGIPLFHRSTAIELQENGALTTPLGRKRQFWSRLREDSTLREAVAFIPQSLVADITNMALYNIWYHLEPEVQILAQIHDAVILQIPTTRVDELLPRVLQYMTVPIEVKGRTMTIEAEAEVGLNWSKFDKDTNPEGLKKWTN